MKRRMLHAGLPGKDSGCGLPRLIRMLHSRVALPRSQWATVGPVVVRPACDPERSSGGGGPSCGTRCWVTAKVQPGGER